MQLSSADLAHFDWSRAYRKQHLYFDKSLEQKPGTTWTIFFAEVFKILGTGDNFNSKFTELELWEMKYNALGHLIRLIQYILRLLSPLLWSFG